MSNPLIMTNQYGEESINTVASGLTDLTTPMATKTILANDTGGSASPTGVTYATIAQHLPAKTGVTALSAVATADATDLATAITLVNVLKAQHNLLLAALKAIV